MEGRILLWPRLEGQCLLNKLMHKLMHNKVNSRVKSPQSYTSCYDVIQEVKKVNQFHTHGLHVAKGLFTWRWGNPGTRGTSVGYPTSRVNVITIKRDFIWTGGLPHFAGLLHLPGVPHLSYKLDHDKRDFIWTGGLPHFAGLPHLSGVTHLHVTGPKT